MLRIFHAHTGHIQAHRHTLCFLQARLFVQFPVPFHTTTPSREHMPVCRLTDALDEGEQHGGLVWRKEAVEEDGVDEVTHV